MRLIYLLENVTKRWGHVYECPNKACKFKKNVEEENKSEPLER